MVEMMQKAAFWNIPLAIAAVGGYLEDYFNIVQGYKAIFLWYFPDYRYLAESAAGDPKRILFPMRDPSSYSPRNYTAGSGMWDIGGFMGVSKDLSSLAPAVDSFVSKVNVTIEQLTEIVRQHKQIGGTHLDEDDKMYSLACDWLKNNPDALELWLVTTSTTTGPTTTTTASTTTTSTTEATTAATGSRNVLDAFLFSMLYLKAVKMSF